MKDEKTINLVESLLKSKRRYMTSETIGKLINRSKDSVNMSISHLIAGDKLDIIWLHNGKRCERAFLHEEAMDD